MLEWLKEQTLSNKHPIRRLFISVVVFFVAIAFIASIGVGLGMQGQHAPRLMRVGSKDIRATSGNRFATVYEAIRTNTNSGISDQEVLEEAIDITVNQEIMLQQAKAWDLYPGKLEVERLLSEYDVQGLSVLSRPVLQQTDQMAIQAMQLLIGGAVGNAARSMTEALYIGDASYIEAHMLVVDKAVLLSEYLDDAEVTRYYTANLSHFLKRVTVDMYSVRTKRIAETLAVDWRAQKGSEALQAAAGDALLSYQDALEIAVEDTNYAERLAVLNQSHFDAQEVLGPVYEGGAYHVFRLHNLPELSELPESVQNDARIRYAQENLVLLEKRYGDQMRQQVFHMGVNLKKTDDYRAFAVSNRLVYDQRVLLAPDLRSLNQGFGSSLMQVLFSGDTNYPSSFLSNRTQFLAVVPVARGLQNNMKRPQSGLEVVQNSIALEADDWLTRTREQYKVHISTNTIQSIYAQ